MKKILKFSLCVIVIVFIVVNIVSSFYFYKVGVARTTKDFLSNNKDLVKTQSVPVSEAVSVFKNTGSWFDSKGFEDVEIKSEDGLKLHGYYLKADIPTTKTAILVHGYSSQGKYMASYAQFYYDTLGYNVLLPDNRGHGQSEGDYIGFGWPDRRDYVRWIEYIIKNVGEDSQIVLHGVSMGGATVLMTSGENLPVNVKAIVSDCAYTSVKAVLSYQLKRMYHLPAFPIINSTSLLTKIRAGYFFGEASALNQVAKSKTPILFIHGAADTFVPSEMVYELYDKSSGEKDIFIVPKATHGTAYSDDKEGYEKKVTEFAGKYIK